ncbi:CD59 glycoprotein isoform X1 [Corvus hawaiiensis]|uniref:CD59 glycoprotein isoform X1 n=1 Tax=Corvus hawaiiensis TaxID=134902 RepID=UPI0020185CD5|nr:CD59 glycoprotein isoform X1 [Corvus hawaiiensis]
MPPQNILLCNSKDFSVGAVIVVQCAEICLRTPALELPVLKKIPDLPIALLPTDCSSHGDLSHCCRHLGRSMTKMNYILLTACIVLIAFCGSGYTLRCYHCDNSPSVCRTNSTCLTTEDTCLQIKFGKLRTFSCWKASQCSVNEIADFFQLDNFEFFCCQHDLCNESAITGVNKAAFSIASVMAMLWMLL